MASNLRQRQPSPSAGQNEKATLLREADEKEISEGQQFILPNFTVKQLLDAIPAHCFHRSTFKSSLYVVQDVILLGLMGWGALNIDSFLSKFNLSTAAFYTARISLYTLYTVAAGLVGTGMWVIGHECGHQGYSSSRRVNYGVGWVIHSALLVPFHSWRITHGQHHAATGHMTRDQVFVPKTRKERGLDREEEAEISGFNVSQQRQADLREALEESPIVSLYRMFLQQTFGWPMYVLQNATGQRHYPKNTNHFTPSSIMFKESQFWQIVMSDVGVILTLAVLAFWAYQRTVSEVVVLYFLPYLWVNNWLVLITFLQHTDPVLPHYSANKWTFARGALATIDRTFFGPIGAWFLHGICETHVAHHISSKIPHYNAWEATAALKEYLGPHYYRDDTNMLVAFWRSYRECIFVEDDQDVVFFKNSRGLAQRYAVEENGNISDSGIDMSPAKN